MMSVNAAVLVTALPGCTAVTAVPPANDYLYLTGGTSSSPTNNTYDAGKFILKFYGYSA